MKKLILLCLLSLHATVSAYNCPQPITLRVADGKWVAPNTWEQADLSTPSASAVASKLLMVIRTKELHNDSVHNNYASTMVTCIYQIDNDLNNKTMLLMKNFYGPNALAKSPKHWFRGRGDLWYCPAGYCDWQ